MYNLENIQTGVKEMYKKYISLKLNDSKKSIYQIRYDEHGSQLEIKLFSEEEVLDLSGCRVKVCANQMDGKSIFKTCQVVSNKVGIVSLDLANHFNDFDVRVPCEIMLYGPDEGCLGTVSFYLVVPYPVVLDNQEMRATDMKKLTLSPKIRMIAHRGLSSLAPENTLPAYELAGKYGYYGAECDIHETKDGVFVLLHDDTLKRMTNGSGKPEDYSLNELKELVVNGGNHVKKYPHLRIPTLEEYLAVCKKWKLVPVIEIKEIEPKSVARLLEILAKWGNLQYVVIISFSKEIVTEVRKLNRQVNVQWLAEMTIENIDYCARYNMDIDCYWKQVSKDLVNYAHSKGVVVNVWTVDFGEEMQRLIDMGIDYISTNVLLYNQGLHSSGKIKSYLFDHRVNYVTCLHSSIDNQGENEWTWSETSRILEIRGNHEAKKMLQIKLPGLNAGDVVSVSFFYRNISGDEVRAGLEYIEMDDAKTIERSIKTKAMNDWGYVDCQFIVMNEVSGNKDYYNVLIGSWSMSNSHFMLRDVRLRIDYM